MKLYPEVFNEYADTSGRLRTKASRTSFRQVCSALQAQHPNQPIHKFTPEQLATFCVGERLAPKTIKHRRAVLQSVFGWAEWKGYIRTNPASSLKYTVSPGQHEVRPGNWLQESEVGIVLRSFGDDMIGRRNRLIMLFGFMLGLRRAELARVRWSHLSPDMRQLHVTGKGQKPATLGVPVQLADELKAWQQEVPAGCDTIFPTIKNVGLVGARETIVEWDKPLQGDGIYDVVRTAGERCEIKLAPHDMRRSFAGMLESKGVSITDTQRAMRHSNVGTTSVYLDKNPRRTVAVTEGLTIEY